MSELIGQTLGQYQITAVLGEGGMATVYRAHQSSINRDVALKVIESKLARNPEFVKRFKREAQTVASLDHPHILKVFDFGQQDDLIYLVMELKVGGTLTAQIAANQLPLERVATLLTQIASALDYAHGHGIIHRDLKPQNVLLDEQGNAFLTDFGIAKLIQLDDTALTQTGAAMGTPTYMSPEQWQGHALDARSDLYALGIMLYEMLTGQVPFRADTPASMMFAHLQQTAPSLRDLRPTLPAYLDPVIQTALAKTPDERFQSAGALADAFKEAINGKPFATPAASVTPMSASSIKAPASPAPTTRRSLNLPLMVAATIIVLLGVGALIIALQRGSNTAEAAATQVAALATNTASASATTASTDAARPSITPAPTDTLTPTVTASTTPSQTSTATITPNVAQTMTLLAGQQIATANAVQTLTATAVVQKSTPLGTPTTIGASTATSLPTSNILYEENFEAADLSEWENRNSIGSIVSDGSNHILHLVNDSDQYVIFQLLHRPWANYAVEVEVRLEQSTPTSTDFFLNIRENPEGGYGVGLDIESSTAGLGANINGDFPDLGTKTINLSMNRWVKLRIQAVDDNLELYVNDRLIRSASDSYHIAGGISFTMAPHTIASIDNLRVIDLEPN